MIKKIALEEHFLSPGFEDYWKTTTGEITPEIFRQAVVRLSEFGELRIAQMDRGDIARAVLSIAGPGGTGSAARPGRPRMEGPPSGGPSIRATRQSSREAAFPATAP